MAATWSSVTSEASRVICEANRKASRSRSDQRSGPAFRSAISASVTPARRRSASAVTRAYSQRLASAATHRILPRSEGPRGLFVRCRRSRSSIAAVVRGKSRAVARAQLGRRDPPTTRVSGRSFQASSFDARGQGRAASLAPRAVPAIVARTSSRDDHLGWIMKCSLMGQVALEHDLWATATGRPSYPSADRPPEPS